MKSLLGPLSGAAFVLLAALTPALAQPQPACSGVVPGDPNFFQQTVFFAVGSSALTAESRTTIQRAAEQIRAQFRDRVCLIGRTSPTGSREANERLAQARIRSVQAELVRLGVQPGIIAGQAQGAAFGAERPGRAENRADRSVMIMYPR
jgi:outer membrane protein OmpA-like peptidoglycan-associated protein